MRMFPKSPTNYEEFRIQSDHLTKSISKNILTQYSSIVVLESLSHLLLDCFVQICKQDVLVAQDTKENLIKELNEIMESYQKNKPKESS